MSNLDRPLFVWLVLCVGTVWNLQGEKSTVCVSDSVKREIWSEVQAITPPTLCYSNSVALSPSVFCLIAAAAKVHVLNNSRQLPLHYGKETYIANGYLVRLTYKANTVEDIAIMQTPTWLKWQKLLDLTETITGVAHAEREGETGRGRDSTKKVRNQRWVKIKSSLQFGHEQ